MGAFRIETLAGGISQILIEGVVEEKELDVYQALSHLSKKRGQILVNLVNLKTAPKRFYELVGELSVRTKIKIISTSSEISELCKTHGLSVYPTVQAASMAYAGDATLSLLLSRLRDVPILNSESYNLIAYVSSGDASFDKLETMVKNNPGLCSQILRMANSSYFLRANRADTLSQALVTLGFMNLRQIFIFNFYAGVGGFFRAQQEVINHGRMCAALAEYICSSVGSSKDECAKVRLGGLLHDIGRQALAFFFPGQYTKVMDVIKNEYLSSIQAELRIFGIDHQTVGGILCNRWNLPSYLEVIVGDHHGLQAVNWNFLTLPVFCANNYLNEVSGLPHQPYFQKLEAYFFLKNRELPWKNIPEAFSGYLVTNSDPFSCL